MGPESLSPDNSITSLIQQLEEDTSFLSGGYEDFDSFKQIIERGEDALPELLSAKHTVNWCGLQAIWTIAHHAGKPIDYPAECLGKLDQVRDVTFEWAISYGYIARVPDTE